VDGEDRGLILSDVMGLGKTVQAVGAIRLVNAMTRAKGESLKPTLVVSPNDAGLAQWEEHLVKAGMDPEKIVRFRTKQKRPLPRDDIVLLCTRYDLLTEGSFILDSFASNDPDHPLALSHRVQRKSPLFPSADKKLLKILENQYKSNNCHTKNCFNEMACGEKLPTDEVIVKHLSREERRLSSGGHDKVFQLLIIDEAHFLRNLKTYWGMVASLAGLHSERTIPLTGTPFNNSPQDIATLMTFIKPSDDASKLKWWKRVAAGSTGPKVKELASQWSSRNLLRREKDIIAHLLPKKVVAKVEVHENNLGVYSNYSKYEVNMIDALKRVHSIAMSDNKKALKEAMAMVLGSASRMQLSLLHPILPNSGRHLTVLFSPSLRNNKAVKKSLEKKCKCVCCNRWVKLAHSNKKKAKSDDAALDLDALEDDFGGEIDDINDQKEALQEEEKSKHGHRNDDDRNLFLYESDEEMDAFNEEKGTGDIVPIGSHLCQFADKGIRHFACESCLETLEENCEECPMCIDLIDRLHMSRTMKRDDQNVYCTDVHGGFVPSAKLEQILNDFKTGIPKDDKVAVVSFFKGSLDMLEAMFLEHGIEVARFDGDLKADERQKQLKKFKTKPSCRVLLMTAQTGGTGLNIVEANHCWFTERYWNPMVL
ncbi:MAG: hypothetical protein SGILL_007492, partial [Bacillariaceae sp.]